MSQGGGWRAGRGFFDSFGAPLVTRRTNRVRGSHYISTLSALVVTTHFLSLLSTKHRAQTRLHPPSRRTKQGRHSFADLAETLMLFGVWVQDRGVLVEKRAVGALPTTLHYLSCCLRPQSKDRTDGGGVWGVWSKMRKLTGGLAGPGPLCGGAPNCPGC